MKQDYIITNYKKHRSYQKELAVLHKPTKKRKKKNRKDTFIPKKRSVTRNYYLYGLRLENGMYYVGMTAYKGAVTRYQQHLDGKGAKWTKLHKPIEMIEVRDIGVCGTQKASETENLMTREYMNKYGMYKVRGGDLCYVKDALVALHFNDNGVKTVIRDGNGRKINRSHANIRRAEKIQEQIAEDLKWIYL